MRDVKEQAEQGRTFLEKHERADLSVSELKQFFDNYAAKAKESGNYDALLEVIGDAFKMGVAVGARNA